MAKDSAAQIGLGRSFIHLLIHSGHSLLVYVQCFGNMFTTSQKFLKSKIFDVFNGILFCSPSLHLFDPK